MEVLSTLRSAGLNCGARRKQHAVPTDGLRDSAAQIVQVSQALSLTCMALGCEMPVWRWGAYLMIPALKQTYISERAVPNPKAHMWVKAHHSIGDLSQAYTAVASIALLYQGNYLVGGANLAGVGLIYLTPKAHSDKLSYLLNGLLLAPSLLNSRLVQILAAGYLLNWMVPSLGLVDWLEGEIREKLQPAKPEDFTQYTVASQDLDQLREELDGVDEIEAATAKLLSAEGMWCRFHASGLTAGEFCQQGLDRVIGVANEIAVLRSWLDVIAYRREDLTIEQLIAVAVAGYSQQQGGEMIYKLYCDVAKAQGKEPYSLDVEIARSARDKSFPEEVPTALTGFLQSTYFPAYWFGCGPSPRLDGQAPPPISTSYFCGFRSTYEEIFQSVEDSKTKLQSLRDSFKPAEAVSYTCYRCDTQDWNQLIQHLEQAKGFEEYASQKLEKIEITPKSSALDWCRKGLQQVLNAGKQNAVLGTWLDAIALHRKSLSEEDLFWLCVAGQLEDKGGGVVYDLYRKFAVANSKVHCTDQVSAIAQIVSESRQGVIRKDILCYWLGGGPSPRLDGKPPAEITDHELVRNFETYSSIAYDINETLKMVAVRKQLDIGLGDDLEKLE